jgi:16S rRNA (guanine966-N2)-methyltransferase
MRVISGQWKGRRLKSPSGDAVRPTTDRVKEAIFNILGPSVNGCVMLDLCCGAGGLGIEALSRGAALVYFVDQSGRSLEVARANLDICGAEQSAYSLVRAEAFHWLAGWDSGVNQEPLVIVADPPYQTPSAGAIMGVLERLRSVPRFSAGIIEYGSRTPGLPADLESGPIWSTRRYGESHLAVIRPGPDGPSEGE